MAHWLGACAPLEEGPILSIHMAADNDLMLSSAAKGTCGSQVYTQAKHPTHKTMNLGTGGMAQR